MRPCRVECYPVSTVSVLPWLISWVVIEGLAAQVVSAESSVVGYVSGAVRAAAGADRAAGLEPAGGVDGVDALNPVLDHGARLLAGGSAVWATRHDGQVAPARPGMVVGVFDGGVLAVADLAFPSAVQAGAAVAEFRTL